MQGTTEPLDQSAQPDPSAECDGTAACADELAAVAVAEAVAAGVAPVRHDTTYSLDGTHAAIDVIDADAALTASAQDLAAGRGAGAAAMPSLVAPDSASPIDPSMASAIASDATVGANAEATDVEGGTNGTNAAGQGVVEAGERATEGASRFGRGAATAAEATDPSAGRAQDPLARLIQSSQEALGSAQSDGRARGVVAGRLAEVEAGIARDRVRRAMADSGVAFTEDGARGSVAGERTGTQDGTAAGTRSTGAAGAAAGDGANLANAGAAGGIAPAGVDGAMLSARGASGADAIASGLAQGPASDLAAGIDSTDDASSSPAARIAARGAELLAKQRGGAITMRLEPPALGQLKIELRIAHGSVVADFTAATPEARMLLESSVGMLRERLESQGLGVERITVHGTGRAHGEVASAQNSQQGDARSQGDARGDGSGRQGDGGARQDAAGGESRGRRDGERRHEDQDARRQGGSAAGERATTRGFAGALADAGAARRGRQGINETRTAESVRRAG